MVIESKTRTLPLITTSLRRVCDLSQYVCYLFKVNEKNVASKIGWTIFV